jgi:hypothetical protein
MRLYICIYIPFLRKKCKYLHHFKGLIHDPTFGRESRLPRLANILAISYFQPLRLYVFVYLFPVIINTNAKASCATLNIHRNEYFNCKVLIFLPCIKLQATL